MSTTADLIGLGMPSALASRIGNTPASIAGIGTTQTGAAALSGGGVMLITPAATNTAFVLVSGHLHRTSGLGMESIGQRHREHISAEWRRDQWRRCERRHILGSALGSCFPA